MAKIQILSEGYATKKKNGWQANSTVCLITSGSKKIITDPGCNRPKLLNALTRAGLVPQDIDFVFLSHQHPDHTLLAGIFPRAKQITFDANLMYDQDHLSPFPWDILGKDVRILETPGHVLEHLSLVVTTDQGKIAVAGDTIWWTTDEKQVFKLNQKDHSQAKGMNMKKLIASRKKLIKEADYIIPGHGKIFSV
ncbi:MAG TPA: MBL fold metallo-hydrolase [Patescibacteria group bacterium]|nr:MBL fold metallo-hydrolase [Patescibacteria group bacterium]